MTREEAIDHLKTIGQYYSQDHSDPYEEYENLTKDELDAIYLAIKALEQEPSREFEDYENEIEDLHNRLDIAEYDKERLREEVTNLEAKIQALEQEPKTGHWIENAPEYQNIDPPYICSECGNMHIRKTNYCDQCGAKMVEPQESEG